MIRPTLFLAALALGLAGQATAQPRGCPPGLAKKNPPCVPPGLARSGDWRIGDRYDGDLIFVDRDRFGLPPLRNGEGYVRVGDNILKLDRETRVIIDLLALALN
ncbi:MAG: excinuclease ABC subunit A [Pseudomonadota bacterium]